jgi:ABC-type glycerol-3-phosphate transport system substrate-binding protein
MELSNRMQAALGTPNQPDLVEIYPELAAAWEKDKPVRVDFNPYLNDPVWGVEPSMAADIPSGIWQPVAADMKQFGIPAYRSALALAYNQTWAQELGFSHPPATTAEFQEQSCAAAKALLKTDSKLDDGLGGWIVDTRALTAASWLRAFSVNPWAAADGSYTYNLPGSSTAFGFLKDMLDQGCIWVARNPQPYGYFANRQALFYTLSSDDLVLQERASTAAKDNWVVIPFPSSDGQPVVLTEGPDWTLLEGQPETQLASWLFVRWMLDPARQADLATTTGSLPVRATVGIALNAYQIQHPQWAEFWKLAQTGEPVPGQPNWTVTAPVLQDAFSQIFLGATTREQLPDILIQLDQTIHELLGRTS